MSKRVLFFLILLFILTSCTTLNITATEAVDNLLNSYINLDNNILKQIDDSAEIETYTEEEKELYKEILKRQYSSLEYRIVKETYTEDTAYITAEITVFNYLKVQNEATDYLLNNPQNFNNSEGDYDKNIFLNYKLNKMRICTDTIDYNIEFKVLKNNNNWEISPLSNDDLKKIHGIYENP